MSTSREEVKELLVEILRAEDVAAATPGIFVQRLEHQHGVEMERIEVTNLLEELRDEDMMEYHLGEFREYGLVDEK